jgi:hypothetical protein
LTVTTSAPENREHIRDRIAFSDGEAENEYSRNVQISPSQSVDEPASLDVEVSADLIPQHGSRLRWSPGHELAGGTVRLGNQALTLIVLQPHCYALVEDGPQLAQRSDGRTFGSLVEAHQWQDAVWAQRM